MKRKTFVALLHAPIVNRHGKEVVTAVTNLDIHDIARSCKTYGIARYFIVNPEEEQERLVRAIVGHWHGEVSKVHHPSRAQALELVQYARTFREAFNEAGRVARLENPQALNPFVVMPDAKPLENAWSYPELRRHCEEGRLSESDDGTQPLMIVFGTGWGISPAFYPEVHRFLKPLRVSSLFSDATHYNHLSVRAAAAIVLDRIFGE